MLLYVKYLTECALWTLPGLSDADWTLEAALNVKVLIGLCRRGGTMRYDAPRKPEIESSLIIWDLSSSSKYGLCRAIAALIAF